MKSSGKGYQCPQEEVLLSQDGRLREVTAPGLHVFTGV